MIRRIGMALALLLMVACAGPERMSVPVVLRGPSGGLPGTPVVVATWLGSEQRVVLEEDALDDGGARYTGTLSGPPIRLLPVRIEVDGPGASTAPWYSAVEVMRIGEPLNYAVDVERAGNIRRVPFGEDLPGNGRALRRLLGLRAAWAGLALLLVIGVAAWRSRSGPLSTRWPWWWDLLLWASAAVLLTWPAARAGPGLMVGRHFDMPGTIWAIDAVPRLFPRFRDGLTGFPAGADYRAFDSFTLVPLGLALAWLDPTRLDGLVQVLGVAASGWGATVAARGFGARGLPAHIAGLGFAASGLAASALMEGHVYHLLDPWLPLFTWAWWRATRPGGGAIHGAAAGLCFGLALWTTGYLAAAGGLLLAGIGLSGLWTHGPRWRAWGTALAVVTPFVALALLSLRGHDPGGFHDPEAVAGSAVNLAVLLGPTAETDLVGHSLAPAPLPTVLALACLAPLVLGRSRGWRPLALTALLALVLSFGPRLSAGQLEPFGVSPLAGLWQLPGAALLRFPARLGWAWTLCLSIVAARVATVLAPDRRGGALLVLALAIDIGFVVGLPGRQGMMAGGASSAYAEAGGAVFELLPESIDDGGEIDSWMSALACYRQTLHHQPLAEDCLTVPVSDNPRFVLGRELQPALLAGRVAAARGALLERGFRAVAWQPDLFSTPTRARLAASLSALDPAPCERFDGGQHVLLYRLDDATTAGTGDPTAEVGALRGADEGPARLEELELLLRVPRRIGPPPRLRAVLDTASGELSRTITSVSSLPGDWPGDAGWLTRWTDPGPGPYRLRLEAPGEAAAPLWTGRLVPALGRDRVELAVERSADGRLTARPLGLCAPSNSLALNADTGLVAVVGWQGWLLVFALAGGWLRRRWCAIRPHSRAGQAGQPGHRGWPAPRANGGAW